mmetsp:Transcript_33078/g.69175  ORF Transcript_33078/g.69175 Transcript_33078/m.69175 type:complete len:204 (-) Transcript_33078:137-748(-)
MMIRFRFLAGSGGMTIGQAKVSFHVQSASVAPRRTLLWYSLLEPSTKTTRKASAPRARSMRGRLLARSSVSVSVAAHPACICSSKLCQSISSLLGRLPYRVMRARREESRRREAGDEGGGGRSTRDRSVRMRCICSAPSAAPESSTTLRWLPSATPAQSLAALWKLMELLETRLLSCLRRSSSEMKPSPPRPAARLLGELLDG